MTLALELVPAAVVDVMRTSGDVFSWVDGRRFTGDGDVVTELEDEDDGTVWRKRGLCWR